MLATDPHAVAKSAEAYYSIITPLDNTEQAEQGPQPHRA